MSKKFLSLLLVLIFVFLYGQNAFTQATSSRFKVPITLTNGTDARIVWIGVSGDGPNPPGTIIDNTIGVDTDPSFGTYQEALAPPPPPPPFTFDVRITTIPGRVSTFPTGLAGGVYQDYRGFSSANQIDSFKIVISGDDTDNLPTTISWPNNLNLYASTWTIKPQTGTNWPTTNMLTSTSVDIPEGGTKNIIIIKTGANPVGVRDELEIPLVYKLEQNYPNPFNPTTVIRYHLPSEGFTTLKIYNVLGNKVATLVSDFKTVGTHTVTLDGIASGLSSGVYYYRIQSGAYSEVKKMMLLK